MNNEKDLDPNEENRLRSLLEKTININGRCTFCNSYTNVCLVIDYYDSRGKLMCADCQEFGQAEVNGPFANINYVARPWREIHGVHN